MGRECSGGAVLRLFMTRSKKQALALAIEHDVIPIPPMGHVHLHRIPELP